MGPRAGRLRRGRPSPVRLLQLRRRHADRVSGSVRFEVVRDDPSGARLGGVETPAFMPVTTLGSVKGLTPRQLEEVGAEIVLANAYHLAQRPGVETVQALGGLHALMGWRGPILSDSGGYQLMSLA